MMNGGMTQSVSGMFNPGSAEAYTARASISGGSLDPSSSKVTGKRTGGIFSDKNDVSKDDFLLLLTTQLRYQDPLNPMDNTEFVSQLAQFRTLEGTNNMEKTLRELKESFQGTVEAQKYSANSITNAAAVSLIGKEVRLRETRVFFHGVAGQTVPIRVHLGNDRQARVQLLDAAGEVVKTFSATGKDAQNSVTVQWDGMTDAGTYAKAGSYTIRVEGQDTNPALYAFVEDVVQGVRFSASGAMLKVGGKDLSIGDIMDVAQDGSKRDFDSLSPASAIALLGKQVRLARDSISYNAGPDERVDIRINLGGMQSTTIRLFNASEKEVRALNAVADRNGMATVVWDGLLADGTTTAGSGAYTIRIDGAQDNPSVYSFIEGTIDGISMAGSVPQVRMNGQTVSLSRIIDIAMVNPVGEDAV